jgi:hypothetical protein
MSKFNKFDQHVLESALVLWQAQFEKEITESEVTGKRLIFDISYPSLVAKDIKLRIHSLTKKK